jgi:hypothetical protein
MIAVTNKESPTVVSPYSQTKSLQSVKSVLTTNSLSPEQSSMPSVTQVPNYPSGSSSPESGVSTPVSDKTFRLRSPVSGGSIAFPLESELSNGVATRRRNYIFGLLTLVGSTTPITWTSCQQASSSFLTSVSSQSRLLSSILTGPSLSEVSGV